MRQLDTVALDGAARFLAGEFLRPSRFSPTPGSSPGASARPIAGRDYTLRTLFDASFKDEFDYLIPRVRDWLGRAALAEFDDEAGRRFTPREDAVLEAELRARLGIDPGGGHVAGAVGRVVIGARFMGLRAVEVETPDSIRWRKRNNRPKSERETHTIVRPAYWPIYAGEGHERAAGAGPDIVDPLPAGTPGLSVGALNPRISNEAAIAACDGIVDRLDEGTGAAVIQGRSGAQPADPDTAVTGTLLFTLVMSDPAFGAAADAAPGGIATAAAITNDASADATGTLGYCRASASNDGATPLDDHIDGEAGTGTADFVFNTLAIVSGAVISMTSFTVTQPES
jgi:hypothetical protein